MNKGKVKIDKTNNIQQSKAKQDAAYNIFRACRFCGATAGYKMPIAQKIIRIENNEVEIIEKIRECLQIEISENDNMPPLICEVCVRKVSEFYEFLLKSRMTIKKTRMRLGLPLETVKEITTSAQSTKETVGENKGKLSEKLKPKKEQDKKDVKIKDDKTNQGKTARRRNEFDYLGDLEVTTPRPRNTRLKDIESTKSESPPPSRPSIRNSKVEKKETKPEKPETKTRRRNEFDYLGDVEVTTPRPRNTRLKDIEPRKSESPPPKPTLRHSKVEKKSKPDKSEPKKEEIPTSSKLKRNSQATSDTPEVVKKKPKAAIEQEAKEPEVVGHCKKCNKPFHESKKLVKHQSACRGGTIKIPPSIRRRIKPVYVRMVRCDPLLKKKINKHYDVSTVRYPYGFDKSCVYPYKAEPPPSLNSNQMVDIKIDEIVNAFHEEDEFVHWDSDDTGDEGLSLPALEKKRNVETLTNITLKVIFSDKLIGKVPKKRKKFKSFNHKSTFDHAFRLNIDKLIDNLDDEDKQSSKSAFDTAKDNWSDNASDSILKNDYDSDVTNYTEDLNDDSQTGDTSILKDTTVSANFDVNSKNTSFDKISPIEADKTDVLEDNPISRIIESEKSNADINQDNQSCTTSELSRERTIDENTNNNRTNNYNESDLKVCEDHSKNSFSNISFDNVSNSDSVRDVVFGMESTNSKIELVSIQILPTDEENEGNTPVNDKELDGDANSDQNKSNNVEPDQSQVTKDGELHTNDVNNITEAVVNTEIENEGNSVTNVINSDMNVKDKEGANEIKDQESNKQLNESMVVENGQNTENVNSLPTDFINNSDSYNTDNVTSSENNVNSKEKECAVGEEKDRDGKTIEHETKKGNICEESTHVTASIMIENGLDNKDISSLYENLIENDDLKSNYNLNSDMKENCKENDKELSKNNSAINESINKIESGISENVNADMDI